MAASAETILAVLVEAGFERLPKPLIVAGSTFDFDAAASGTGVSHDLVVVATGDARPRRLAQMLSALSRTLDQVNSKRPVTLVMSSATPDASSVADLERHARVLRIASDDPEPEEVRRAVAVLMPLVLPAATSRGSDPLSEVAKLIGPSASKEHQALIDSAKSGPDAVRDALRRYIDEAASGVADNGAAP